MPKLRSVFKHNDPLMVEKYMMCIKKKIPKTHVLKYAVNTLNKRIIEICIENNYMPFTFSDDGTLNHAVNIIMNNNKKLTNENYLNNAIDILNLIIKYKGRPSLHTLTFAIRTKNLKIVEIILKTNPDADDRTLMCAMASNNLEIIKIINKKNIKSYYDELTYAYYTNNHKIFKTAIILGGCNKKNNFAMQKWKHYIGIINVLKNDKLTSVQKISVLLICLSEKHLHLCRIEDLKVSVPCAKNLLPSYIVEKIKKTAHKLEQASTPTVYISVEKFIKLIPINVNINKIIFDYYNPEFINTIQYDVPEWIEELKCISDENVCNLKELQFKL